MLTALICIPILFALVLLMMSNANSSGIARISVIGSSTTFFLSLVLVWMFDSHEAGMQFVEDFKWIPMLNIHYLLGVDGISIWMVSLTTLLSSVAIFYGLRQKENLRFFMILLLVLEAGTLGVFLSLDTILFYVFWELMLVPTYFLIGIWGEGDRIYATTKFVIYTLVGSLLMLVAMVALSFVHYNVTHHLTFDIRDLQYLNIDHNTQIWMFLFFFIAFAIKIPIFPFHSWLPHTYVACPIPVLILLTGVMSKTGAYGFIRFVIPLFPEAMNMMGWFVGGMAAVGMVYGAWAAIAQKDIKSLVAWSSVSHLGFIVLGIFALTDQGMEGSILQMVNHGIIASALFIIVGFLEEKVGSRNLENLRGLRKAMPFLYGAFMLITMAALGLPGLNGFVGEFLILVGVWTSNAFNGYSGIYVLFGGLSIVFASIYMLYFFQGVMQEKNENLPQNLKDIDEKEAGLLVPACILILVIGLYPKPFIDKISHSAKHVLHIEKTIGEKTLSGGH